MPGGTYYRTYTNSGDGGTKEAAPATVSGFRLDKYLVTVGRFRQFVNAWADAGAGVLAAAGAGKHAHLNGGAGLAASDGSGSYELGWNGSWSTPANVDPTDTNLAMCAPYATWTPNSGSHETLPIDCVTFYEAYAFCIWDGGFLPSEAEWEFAAAGGSEQREWPWGSTPPGTSNEYAIYGVGCYFPTGTLQGCTGTANIAPVGSAPMGAGLWGQLDLAGEMWERNLDQYAGSLSVPCVNCADITASTLRVIRGANYGANLTTLNPWVRANETDVDRDPNTGFRCARSP